MTRQEPRPDQKDDEKESKYPEAKARWPWPVFRQGAPEEQSGGETDRLRRHGDRSCAPRTFRAAALQNRGGGRACCEADAAAHQRPSREYPIHVRCDRKQKSADERSKQAHQHRRTATNLVGNAAEADQHHNDSKW